MTALGWLTSCLAEVPGTEGWLGDRERRVLAALRVPKRRADWRLGRWTAKAAVSAWLDVPVRSVEIIAAADGAPEPWVDGRRAPVSVSLSHRGGRALAVVTSAPGVVGCDLELVEPRSLAFTREWFAATERLLVATFDGRDRDRVANLLWTAKEAAAKARREGLRLDFRQAVVQVGDPARRGSEWRPFSVEWPDTTVGGWWRDEPGWVLAIAGEPAPGLPRRLPDRDLGGKAARALRPPPDGGDRDWREPGSGKGSREPRS
jgi:4'-phosphopantetheinyl transferase